MGKPTYLPLLNSIAVNEAKGEELLRTWARTTRDRQLRGVLEFVAIREGEHAKAFAKRMCELGYEVDEDSAYQVFKDFDGLIECVSSNASDGEKVATLGGLDGEDRPDPFRGFFNDTTIDPLTGELLGRYIAEERDSGRRLRAEYERVCAEATEAGSSARAAAEPGGHDNEILMVSLKSGVKELADCVAGLQDDIAKLRREVKKLKNR